MTTEQLKLAAKLIVKLMNHGMSRQAAERIALDSVTRVTGR